MGEFDMTISFPFTPIVVDLYHGDQNVDFSIFTRMGTVWGVIHKATQGNNFHDALFSMRRKRVQSLGLLYGAYHFGTGDTVKSQVDSFLTAVGDYTGLLLALDWEDHPQNQMSLSQAEQFCQMVADKTGRWPVLYSGDRVKDALGKKSSSILARCRLWLAEYGPKPVTQVSWPEGPWLWQYTERGRIPGIACDLDFNSYKGLKEQLTAEWTTNKESLVS